MKTIREVMIDDYVFIIKAQTVKINKVRVSMILNNGYGSSPYQIQTNFNIKRYVNYNQADLDKPFLVYEGYYLFSDEGHAFAYAKRQALKELNSRIEAAIKAIHEVKNFRKEYWDQLNNEWLDKNIVRLEKELK